MWWWRYKYINSASNSLPSADINQKFVVDTKCLKCEQWVQIEIPRPPPHIFNITVQRQNNYISQWQMLPTDSNHNSFI